MKSFNNWIFIELKTNSGDDDYLLLLYLFSWCIKATGQTLQIHLIRQSIQFILPAKNFFVVWCRFPFRFSSSPSSPYTYRYGRYAEWVSFVAENEITLSHAERLPFALIAIHFVLGKMKETRNVVAVRRKRSLIWWEYCTYPWRFMKKGWICHSVGGISTRSPWYLFGINR